MIETLVNSDSTATCATSAHCAVQRNFSANLRALRQSQPLIAGDIETLPTDLEWAYARDGSLTALLYDAATELAADLVGCAPRTASSRSRDSVRTAPESLSRDTGFQPVPAATDGEKSTASELFAPQTRVGNPCHELILKLGADTTNSQCHTAGRRWWAGCSLPSRAAEFMLKKAALDGTLLCFLYARHAAQIRVTLNGAQAGQALLALVPDTQTLKMILACDDFSAEMHAHRLYFTAGPHWESQLDQLFEQLPGLPTPTQFIRPILADSTPADEMIAPAQKVFAAHADRRAQRVRVLRKEWKSAGVRRICVVAPSLFRLWDDTGHALAGAMDAVPDGIEILRFNSDDPASASSAALAEAAASCDAIVTPNAARADLPNLLPDEMPWATWITLARMPSAEKAGPRDTLLVADPAWKEMAVQRGWKSDCVFVAWWPVSPLGESSAITALSQGLFRMPPSPSLAMICDTQPLDPPARVTEYSSHRLLWESIQQELLEDPFLLDESPDAYLTTCMRRARVEEEGFDRAAFLDGVVLHAWQQGIARAIIREKLPLKLHGKGWDALDEFSDFATGPINSRAELDAAASSATALIHAWPTATAHPIDVVGKPVIRARRKREAFIRDARRAISAQLEIPRSTGDALSSSLVVRALSVDGKH